MAAGNPESIIFLGKKEFEINELATCRSDGSGILGSVATII